MIATSLIHLAIWTQFALANCNSIATVRAALKADHPLSSRSDYWRWPSDTSELPREKVTLLETTVGEKLGLDNEPTTVTDTEAIALYYDVYQFASHIDWVLQRKTPVRPTPVISIAAYWDKRLSYRLDDNFGYWPAGEYHPFDFPDPARTFSFCLGGSWH